MTLRPQPPPPSHLPISYFFKRGETSMTDRRSVDRSSSSSYPGKRGGGKYYRASTKTGKRNGQMG